MRIILLWRIYYLEPVLSSMAKFDVSFTLLDIGINDTYVNPEVGEAEVADMKAFSWQFSYDFTFADYTENYEKVMLQFWFELARNEDDAVMTTLDVTNTFQVTAGVPNEAKPEILQLFFDISITNIQGIFAAITDRSPLAVLMLPDINQEHYTSHLQKIVQDDWWRF